MITATFMIYYLTNNGTQALDYAFSTSPTSSDVNATVSMYYMSQGYACGIKTTLNIHKAIYISSTSTSVYRITFSALSNPVFNISSETSTSITSIRIGQK